jgi:purine-binding chemotaxis protein CheW
VPQTPAHVKGVINLRGKVIPVVDLRLKLGLLEQEYTPDFGDGTATPYLLGVVKVKGKVQILLEISGRKEGPNQ